MSEKPRLPQKFLLAALLASAPGVAFANGRFPESNQVVFDPSHSEHLLVRTTFGLLESRDGAKSFSWICEAAFDSSGVADPMLAITARGAQVIATFTGIRRSVDGCSYQTPAELAGQLVPDLALDPSDARRLLAFRAQSLGGGMFESALLRSEDEGQTWVPLEPPLPSDLLPLSVDFAKSDSRRIYLSARSGSEKNYVSVLLRSLDSGRSFEAFEIPDTGQEKLAFVAAVDPNDADHVFVRVDDPVGTRVLVTSDSGQTFRELFRGSARLPGFALSSDGSELALGGPSDGLWIGALDGVGLEQRSTVAPSCLGYGPDGLYACSDATEVGTLLLRSRDGGISFERLVTFGSLCGVTACDDASDVALACRAEWDDIAPVLGTTCGTTRLETRQVAVPRRLTRVAAAVRGRRVEWAPRRVCACLCSYSWRFVARGERVVVGEIRRAERAEPLTLEEVKASDYAMNFTWRDHGAFFWPKTTKSCVAWSSAWLTSRGTRSFRRRWGARCSRSPSSIART